MPLLTSLADISDISVKFGSVKAPGIVPISSTVKETTGLFYSPPIESKSDAGVKTVTISSVSNPSITTSFQFTYIWKDAPKIVDIYPSSADTSSGAEVEISLQDISPYSEAKDVTVVFQQGTETPCAFLFEEANTVPPQWVCLVNLPSTGLSAAAADPTGIAVWTNKQTRSKMANYAFTYLEAELPVYSWHSPEAGPVQGSFTTVEFNNYCQQHDMSDLSVTFTHGSGSDAATIQSYNYDGDCTTTLSVDFPNLDAGYESTVTVQVTTGKSFTFGYNFQSVLYCASL